MEKTENKYISVAYKLYTIEEGEREFTEEAPADNPFSFISGLGQTIEAFENKVKNLAKGEKFDFVISQNEAYGEYDDEKVIELPKSVFFINGVFDDQHVQEGAIIPLASAEGDHFSAVVTKVKAEVVEVDLNHPLAGCDLNFIGEVTESRIATPEEIKAMTAGGCSCKCNCDKGTGECDCCDNNCNQADCDCDCKKN